MFLAKGIGSRVIAAGASALVNGILLCALVWLPNRGEGLKRDRSGTSLHVFSISLAAASGEDEQASEKQIAAGAAAAAKPSSAVSETFAVRGYASRDTRSDTSAVGLLGSDKATEASAPASFSSADYSDYLRRLRDHLAQYRRAPQAASREPMQGVVMLSFVMDRTGHVLDAWVDQTSGFTPLDLEAVATARRAQPLPIIPQNMPDRLEVVVPVAFTIE